MKTLVVDEKGALSVQEVPMPVYGEYEALVKTISCGVCNGTDAKLIHGAFKGYERPKDYPMTLGHEAVGRVVEIGAKVKGLKVGDNVLLPFAGPFPGITSGWGAYSEYGTVFDAKGLAEDGIAFLSDKFPECAMGQSVLPPDIDPVDGAMIITLREVLSTIKTFGIKPNDSVAVFGCGPVGLTFIKFMSLLGVHPVMAFDIFDEKIEEARKKGANYAFNSKTVNPVEKVREICPDGVDFVLDAVGFLPLINQAMEMIKDRGHICCYGISPKANMELDWSKAPYNWNLCFQQFPRKDEEGACHNQILAWLRAGVIDLKDYISDIIDFEDILTAFEKVEKREISKKCIIRYKD